MVMTDYNFSLYGPFQIGRFAFNNLQEFVCETYASHIVRSVLEVCSGVDVPSSLKSSRKSHLSHSLYKNEGWLLTVPPKMKELLKDLALRFQKLPDLAGMYVYSQSIICSPP